MEARHGEKLTKFGRDLRSIEVIRVAHLLAARANFGDDRAARVHFLLQNLVLLLQRLGGVQRVAKFARPQLRQLVGQPNELLVRVRRPAEETQRFGEVLRSNSAGFRERCVALPKSFGSLQLLVDVLVVLNTAFSQQKEERNERTRDFKWAALSTTSWMTGDLASISERS